MKKKILCLVMAAVMTVGTAVTAYAEEFKSDKNWYVDFDGNKMNSNFTSQEMAQEIYGILPGDTMKMEVQIKNSGKGQTDWYMSNEILKSLEEGSKAENGAYTYILTYDDAAGEETVLYDSDTVGGEGVTDAGEGLHQATDALEEYFYLDRLDTGKSGTVHLTVCLEGETQGNNYQNTLARLQMNFAVEKVEPSVIVEKGEDKIIKKTVTGKSTTIRKTVVKNPKTGDTANLLLFSAAALVSGIVLLVLGIMSVKKRSKNEKGELKS
ncbi:MAG: sortase B protein-sorting domain-containing protein [Blautia sp.]